MDPMQSLFSAAAAFFSVAAIGAVKKYTTLADTKIGTAIKPVQPVLALIGAVAIPFLAGKLHITAPDPQLFMVAPTATIIAIAAAEAQRRIFKGA